MLQNPGSLEGYPPFGFFPISQFLPGTLAEGAAAGPTATLSPALLQPIQSRLGAWMIKRIQFIQYTQSE